MPGQPKLKSLHSASLVEFMYTVLYNATPEQLAKLKGRLSRIMKNSVAAKSFCVNSSMDEKLIVLNELGIGYQLLISNKSELCQNALKSIKETADLIKDDKKALALKRAIKDNTFLMTNKEQEAAYGIMAQVADHPSFKMELEFNRVAYHMKKWPKDRENDYSKTLKTSFEDRDYINKFLFSATQVFDRAQSHFKLSYSQMRILLFLYSKRNTYVHYRNVAELFFDDLAPRSVSRHMVTMRKEQYIQYHAKDTSMNTITAKGITVINNLFSKIFNHMNFE